MELQRDNQKDRGVTSIPYNPDLFHNDRDFYLAYKKVEHIVAAVFLVTGLIDQEVLMKNAIREHSLLCLNRIVALIGKSGVSVTDLQGVASHLLHLTSLLDIAFWSGHVSQMNLTILQKELSQTYQTLNDLSTKYKNSFYIDASFFKTDKEILNDIPVSPIKTSLSQNQQEIKNQADVYKGQNKRQAIKDINKGQEPIKDNKQDRREAILSLLRQRSNLTVKDFTTVVTEYSEKTIQRELLALVDEGIIRKEGERRWSTYSLAT